MNAAELATAMLQAKADIDDAFVTYHGAIQQDADKDRAAKLAKATAYVTVRTEIDGKVPVAEIEARVDLATADLQHAARMAEGLKRSAGMAVDARKQWLSALQSLASLTKAEAQLTAWEPRETQNA